MRTARGLGWEQIGKSITDICPADSKRAVTRATPRASRRNQERPKNQDARNRDLRISDQPRRCLAYFQHGQIKERIPHALPRENAAVRPLNSGSFTVSSLPLATAVPTRFSS